MKHAALNFQCEAKHKCVCHLFPCGFIDFLCGCLPTPSCAPHTSWLKFSLPSAVWFQARQLSKQLVPRSLLPLEKFKNLREITHSATLRRSCHFYHIAIIIVPFLAHVNSIIDACQKLYYTKNTEKGDTAYKLLNILTCI